MLRSRFVSIGLFFRRDNRWCDLVGGDQIVDPETHRRHGKGERVTWGYREVGGSVGRWWRQGVMIFHWPEEKEAGSRIVRLIVIRRRSSDLNKKKVFWKKMPRKKYFQTVTLLTSIPNILVIQLGFNSLVNCSNYFRNIF